MLPLMQAFGFVRWYTFLCASDVALASVQLAHEIQWPSLVTYDHASCIFGCSGVVGYGCHWAILKLNFLTGINLEKATR